MFLRQVLTVTILCLAVRGEEHEIMPKNNDQYLSKLYQLKMPTVFETACTPAASDLIFALDGSASIHLSYFTKGVEMIKASVDKLNSLGLLGSGDAQTQVGAFQFGQENYAAFPLLDDYSLISDSLNGIFYQNSSMSRIADAVNWALTEKTDFFASPKARASVNKVLVVLTDCLDNCPNTLEKEAKANADKAGVTLLLVHYTNDFGSACINTLTGGDASKHHLWSDVVGDVSSLTGCPPTPTSEVSTTTDGSIDWSIICEHNGTASCTCEPGWTGPTCDIPLDCCFHQVLSDGKYINASYCNAEHGICIKDDQGCKCACKNESAPWTGPTCNIPPGPISRRCIAYENPEYTGNVTYRCNLTYERCIPDDIDCMFNTGPAKDKDGNPFCPKADRSLCDGLCKCKEPVGWCIDLPAYKRMYLALSKALAPTKMYVIPSTSET